jgi:anti-sigma B factor antagonist
MPLDIVQNELAPGKVVIALTGKIMMGTDSERIMTQVEELLRQGKRTIIFDLGGVTHIDSTGIGRFISSYNKIMAAGGEMCMAGAKGHLFDIFHVSMLDTVFRFYPTVEAACQ